MPAPTGATAAWLFGIAPLVALAAWRARSLSASGAVTAALVGSAAMAASPRWATYLVLWFVAAAALSRMGRAAKAAHTAGIVAKGDRRDAWQVIANGGVFGVLMAPVAMSGDGPAHGFGTLLTVAAAASLAAAAADTWATEVGTRVRGTAWSLRTRTPVAAGTSGAVTTAGSLAMLAGAAVHAALAAGLGLVPAAGGALAVAAGGIAGALADTILGAWLQARRRCPACGTATEQRVHDCGTPTVRAGGAALLDNDAVNLACTVTGAATGAGTFALFRAYLGA